MFSRTSIRTARRSRVLRAAAPVAVLALALTACGGSDSGGESAGKEKQGTSEGKPKGDSPEGGEEGAPGGLKAGESVTAAFKEDDAKITYEIAAQKVDVATEAETAKLVEDPKDAKGLVAATAHVKFTNKSGGVVESSPDAGSETEIYADGARGGLLMFADESAAGCDDTLDIENWKAGQSYTICQTYMIPANAKSIEVRWPEKGGATHSWGFAAK
ncbi:hypothetical protein GUY60_18960 [Streptomyces sp. YC537]|uniref:Lipoprotein n=2 Tax=Streptomyces boluensis TaxID=1775135 RepID=A0A964XMS1_9ACTN|nr:hypothetical protein [Streptomyces boluensis]